MVYVEAVSEVFEMFREPPIDASRSSARRHQPIVIAVPRQAPSVLPHVLVVMVAAIAAAAALLLTPR